MNPELIKKSNRRAWLVVITGFTCFFMIYGAAYNCLGLFMKPMAETFEVPRAVISSLFTVTALGGLVFVPLVGRIVDKREIKLLLLAGSICISLAFFTFANAPSVPFLYLGAVIESIGIACTINMPIAIMIKNWFAKKQGFATGATIVGSGIGGSILSQVVTYIISGYDWQTAYMFIAVLTFVTTVPLILLFARKSPASVGLYRYGEYDSDESQDEKSSIPEVDPELEKLKEQYSTVSTFIKTPEYFLLFFGLLIMVLPLIGVKSHMVAYMTDLGHSAETSSLILTLCLLAAIPGAPVIGMFFDKFGTIKTLVICCLCLSIGMFALSAVSVSIVLAFFFSIVYGFATMIQAVGVPLIFTDVLRTNHNFATIMSITGVSMSIGSAFGTLLIGLVYDIFGSYVIAFIASGIAFIIGFIMIITAVTKAHKRHSEMEKLCSRK